MNNNNGAISFKALLDTRDFERGRFRIESQLKELTRIAEQEANRFDSVFKRAGQAMAAYFTFDAARQMIGDLVKVRGEFQQLEIAFTTMLQSKSRADKLMSDAVQFATLTPYGLEATAAATKQLLAYGESADTVIETLRKLGDIASGLNIPLSDIAYLYGTTLTQGRLYTQDFNQFVGRGIPLIKELSAQFGVAESEVKGLVEAGKVGFPEIKKVIDNMTASGSVFGGLMEAQSKSIPGKIEQLKDAWAQMLNEIGKSNEGVINTSIQNLASLVENYEQVGRVLAGLVATYGSYKAALILTATIERTVASSKAAMLYLQMSGAVSKLTLAHRARALAIGVEAAAQRALNSAMLANPYALVAAAVVGLTATIWALNDGTTSAEKAQKALNSTLEEAKQKKEQLSRSVTGLISVIRDETQSLYEQIRAYDELIAKLPELGRFSRADIQRMPQADLDKIVNQTLSSRDIQEQAKELETLRKQLQAVNEEKNKVGGDSKVTNEIKKSVKELDSWKTSYDDVIAYLELHIAKLEEQQKLQEQAAELEHIKSLPAKEQIAHYNAQLEKLDKVKRQLETGLLLANQTNDALYSWQVTIDKISLDSVLQDMRRIQGYLDQMKAEGVDKNNKAHFEKVKSDAESELAKMDIAQKGSKEWNAYVQKIRDADKALEAYNVTATKTTQTSRKQPKEKFLEGSIRYYDQQIQELEDKLQRIPVTSANETAIKQLQDKILRLTEARAEAQKAIELRTWQETLDAKREMYRQYEELMSRADMSAGAEIVDMLAFERAKAVYAELLKGGQTYKEFLEQQLAPIADKVLAGEGSKQEIERFIILKKELDSVMGVSSPAERFSELLDGIKNNAPSTAEYIRELERLHATLSETPQEARGSLFYTQVREVDRQLKEARKTAANELQQWLVQLAGSKEKELAIVRKYENLIAQAEKEGRNTEAIHRAYNEEMAENYAKSLEAYKVMNELMGAEDLKRLKAQEEAIKQLIQNLIDAGYGGSEVVKNLQKLLGDKQNEQADKAYQNLMLWQQAIGQAGSELSQLEGTLGNIGQLFAAAAQSAQQFASTYANMTDGSKANDGQAYAAAAQAGVNLISLVIGAAQKRKAKRKQEEANTLQMQLDMNKALIEEIRLRTELSESVFFTDYYGRIADSINAMREASVKAYEIMDKLSKVGQAKNGTKNKIDWGAVGAGAGSGATIGAVAGGGVFSWLGAAIGAVGGALVGLFGAMKKDSRYSALFEIYPELISQSGEFNQKLAEILIANDQVDDKTKQLLQSWIDLNEEIKAADNALKEIIGELTGQMGNELRDVLVTAFEDGTDAAYEFARVVENTIENALSNLIYSAIFSEVFKELEDRLKGAMVGDGTSFQEQFAWFMNQYEDLNKQFNKAMEDAKKAGAEFGFDLWGGSGDRANGMTGAIKSVTEETANVLAGNITQIRIKQAEHTELFRQQLFYLANISRHTLSISEHTQRLDRMDRNLERIANGSSLRDFGGA